MYTTTRFFGVAQPSCRVSSGEEKVRSKKNDVGYRVTFLSIPDSLSLSLSNLYLFFSHSRTPMINDAAIFALDTGKIRV